MDPLEAQRLRRWAADEPSVGPPALGEPWMIRDWGDPGRSLPMPVPRPVEAAAAPAREALPAAEPATPPAETSDMCPACMRKGSEDGSPFVKPKQAA